MSPETRHPSDEKQARLDRLLRGRVDPAPGPVVPRDDLPAVSMARIAEVADTLDMLALAFRDGITDPKTALSHYAQGRADGLAWAAEQLRTTLTDLAQH